eukprot:TRINITY_DN12420_c0_g1_i2.p1 TRINITY_DN12420_c0_g1~~TRINITY_DN12420_c0_g1_i2.p1  ORF type:complete len:384 (+),score=41.21 TRINITY_DN12420_c0_g1_i2:366-1517(+)
MRMMNSTRVIHSGSTLRFSHFTVPSCCSDLLPGERLSSQDVMQGGTVCAGIMTVVDFIHVNVTWLRVLRTLGHLAKVLRVIRIVRFCDQLRVILISVTSSFNSLFWSLVALALIMYLGALVLVPGVTQYLTVPPASSDDSRLRADAVKNWGSVWRAMDTLFRSVTGGGPWGLVAEPLQKAGSFHYPAFVLYIAFLVIGLLKLLTGIFVQHASAASSLDREKGIQSSIEHLFQELDEDQSGSLTVEEFQAKINDPVTMAYFQMLEIDRGDIDELFSLTDVNDNNQIDIHEFIKGCQTYKGYAKKLDARYLRKQISKLTSMTESCLQGVKQLSRTPLSRSPCALSSEEGVYRTPILQTTLYLRPAGKVSCCFLAIGGWGAEKGNN